MSHPKRPAHELFAEAMDQPISDRDRYLRDACADDAELLAEVRALLEAHAQAGEFLRQPAVDVTVDVQDESGATASLESPGTIIGRYKLLQVIGEGGFGSVFMAEQEQPVRRRVALKVIKLGMDTRQVIARFEQERQALAIMDHANIAKVFDAGATNTGRPYFVMELVRGSPITKYCDQHHLSPRQRLELFIPVCQAVQHAHQKGIIHRDIKPSNVLVTEQDGRPIPKVIDFGIAKATQARLTERTVFTEFRQMIGTPAYMSPEQASVDANDIDTRSDIYSLGVLLYELLTGTTPIQDSELRNAAYDQMQKLIRDHEPPTPSSRLTTMGEAIASVAAVRKVEPKQLARSVRGELDWIVMKCLEKDRTRRYESASSLAADVLRHLSGEAVAASPPSHLYRLKKTVMRHRAAIAVVALFLIAAMVGVTIYVWSIRSEQRKTLAALDEVSMQKSIAEHRQRDAEDANRSARAVDQFMMDMLGRVDPAAARGDTITVRQALDSASAQVGESFTDRPLAEAAVRHALAMNYNAIGHADLALPHAQLALTQRRRLLGDDHVDTIATINTLGTALHELARYDQVEPLWREALERSRRTLGPDHPETLLAMHNVGLILREQSKFAEAEPFWREGLEHSRRALGDGHHVTLTLMNSLGLLMLDEGKLQEAEPLARGALDGLRGDLGADHPETLIAMNNYARVMEGLGRLSEAEAMHREALQHRRRVLGDDHNDTLISLTNLAYVLEKEGRDADAEPLCREAMERSARSPSRGPDHIDTLNVLTNFGLLLENQGKYAEAEATLRDALAQYQRTLGADHRDTIIAMHNLSGVLVHEGKFADAEPLSREALERCRKLLGNAHPDTQALANGMANLMQGQGKLKEAEEIYREIVESLHHAPGGDGPMTPIAMINLAEMLRRESKLAEAEALLRDAVAMCEQGLGAEHPNTLHALGALGTVFQDEGKLDDAEPILRKVLELRQKTLGPDHQDTLVAMYNLGHVLERQGKLADALSLFQSISELLVHAQVDPQSAALMSCRAGLCLVKLNRLNEAEAPLRSAWQRLSDAGMLRHPNSREVLAALEQISKAAGKSDDAAAWHTKLEAARASTRPASPPTTVP